MKKPCSESEYVAEKDRSHFYVHRINGVRPALHDRQRSGILPAPSQTTKTPRSMANATVSDCQKSTQSPFVSSF